MSQPWFGQHGAAGGGTTTSNSSQPPPSMHHERFHHGNGPASSSSSGTPQVPTSTYASRNSPTMVSRPPSSASVNSSASYHSAPGAALGSSHSTAINRHQQGHHGGSGNPHSFHGGIHSMPSGRYPMPLRNNGMIHPVRPIPRGPMPPRQHPGMNPGGSIGQHRPGIVSEYGHHGGHSQFAAKPPPSHSNLLGGGRPGQHPRSFHHQQMHSYHHQGSHHHHNGYPPHMNHIRHLAPDQRYHPYENRSSLGSPSVDSHSIGTPMSPSPPPIPPGQSPHPPAAFPDRPSNASSMNALRDRQNYQQGGGQSNSILQGKASTLPTPKSTNEDVTVDAASILLQLSAVVKNDGESPRNDENRNQENDQPSQSQFEKGNTKPLGMSPPVATVEETHPHDDVSTIGPSESAEHPDLTSEPSSDSVESDFPAPIPENYPTRLALPYDDSKLNSLHCFLRSELLEIFVVQKSENKSPTHSPGSSVGRVGLRCVHCAMTTRRRDDRDEAPMAVFYPKSIAEIYRLVTSWQRCHLRKCRNLPPAVRSQWQLLRDNDKSRGKTHYWITSAKEIGLIDCQSRAGGIRFSPDTKCYPKPTTSSSNEDAPVDVPTDKNDDAEILPTVSKEEEIDASVSKEEEEVDAPISKEEKDEATTSKDEEIASESSSESLPVENSNTGAEVTAV